MKQKVIICDLDGVLCKIKPDSERNNHTGNESPIENMVYLIRKLDNIKVLILTGRKEKYRGKTMSWLSDYCIWSEVIMQGKSTADKNHIFKREKLIELKEKYDIIAMLDDNPQMEEVCKDLGVLLLLVKNNEITI